MRTKLNQSKEIEIKPQGSGRMKTDGIKRKQRKKNKNSILNKSPASKQTLIEIFHDYK